jgi:hypothetical protein
MLPAGIFEIKFKLKNLRTDFRKRKARLKNKR